MIPDQATQPPKPRPQRLPAISPQGTSSTQGVPNPMSPWLMKKKNRPRQDQPSPSWILNIADKEKHATLWTLLILFVVIFLGLKKPPSAPWQRCVEDRGSLGYIHYGSWLFRLRNASYPWLLWPHMARAASCWEPSISPRGPCRPVLDHASRVRELQWETSGPEKQPTWGRGGGGGELPKVIPGFSSLTFSRCSFAKNM